MSVTNNVENEGNESNITSISSNDENLSISIDDDDDNVSDIISLSEEEEEEEIDYNEEDEKISIISMPSSIISSNDNDDDMIITNRDNNTDVQEKQKEEDDEAFKQKQQQEQEQIQRKKEMFMHDSPNTLAKKRSNFFDEAFALEDENNNITNDNENNNIQVNDSSRNSSNSSINTTDNILKEGHDQLQPRFLIENDKFDEEEEVIKSFHNNNDYDDDDDEINTPIEFMTHQRGSNTNSSIPKIIERKEKNDEEAIDLLDNEEDNNEVVNNRYDAAYAIENVQCNSSIETQISKLSDSHNNETEIELTMMSDNTSMSAISNDNSSSSNNDDDAINDSIGSSNSSSSSYIIANTPYDSSKYNDLDVSDDIHNLFNFIDEYQPRKIEIEKIPLKCFIPSYIPAIGNNIDECLKIPRPDGKPDGLGLKVIDYEPCSKAKQSDPAVLFRKLSNHHRIKTVNCNDDNTPAVWSIQNANSKNGRQDIQHWIKSIEDIHESSRLSLATKVHYTKTMPNIDTLMQPWSEQFETALIEKQVRLPDINLDISLTDYAKILCSILDIPIHNNDNSAKNNILIESMHLMFSLFLGFESNYNQQLFSNHHGNNNNENNNSINLNIEKDAIILEESVGAMSRKEIEMMN